MTSGSRRAATTVPCFSFSLRWCGVLLGLILMSAGARAQPVEPDDETRSAARQIARDALELMNAENYAAAEDLLRRAHELVPAPTVAVLRGRALEQLDRLIEAAESYEAARRLPEDGSTPTAFREAKQEATERLETLRKQIPLVTITVTGVDVDDERLELRLDDRVLPAEMVGVRRPLDPGQHLIVAAFEETVHDTRWITPQRGEHVKVLMRVDAPKSPPPPPPPPPQKPPPKRFERRHAGVLALVAGGGGFATGIVAGVVMLNAKATLDDGCRPACPAELEDELELFRSTRTISALGYGVGFTGLAVGGGILLSIPPSEPPKTRQQSEGRRRRGQFAASFGPGGVSFSGVLP